MATAFAVFSEYDKSLTFYKRDNVPSNGDMFEGKIANLVCEDIETTEYYYDPIEGSNVLWPSYVAERISFVDTISPISTEGWFAELPENAEVDFTNLDTSNVTNMSRMFYRCYKSSLDLSSFDTSNVAKTAEMFADCAALETIYVSELWSLKSIVDSYNMFSGCLSLSGDITYDSTASDATYATYDGGYLTYKIYVDPNAVYLIKNGTLHNIADKVRVLSGTEEPMTPAEMQTALDTHNTEMTEVLFEQDSIIAQISTVLESKSAPSLPSLPELTNPASADIIPSGYEAIDSDGNVITGTGANLGDATAADVLTGKTFTSSAGLMVAGTLVQNEVVTGSRSGNRNGTNLVFTGLANYKNFIAIADDDGNCSGTLIIGIIRINGSSLTGIIPSSSNTVKTIALGLSGSTVTSSGTYYFGDCTYRYVMWN